MGIIGQFETAQEVGRSHSLLASHLERGDAEETIGQSYAEALLFVCLNGADGELVRRKLANSCIDLDYVTLLAADELGPGGRVGG